MVRVRYFPPFNRFFKKRKLLKYRRLTTEDIKAWGDSMMVWAAHIVYDRHQGVFLHFFAFLLWMLSYIYEGIICLRTWLYETRLFRDEPLGCTVVVVGNLTVGGTGKTPIVEKLARDLLARGRRVAILSRGYKSRSEPMWKRFWRWLTHLEPEPPKIVSDGKTIHLNSDIGGDEPYMLARNLPGVMVLVDKNRVKAGNYAIKNLGADTLILDDGYQYLSLKGQMNLLLIDKTNPFGNRRLLPRGILREPLRHLKRASYIFITKSNGEKNFELENLIRSYHPSVDIIECSHQPQYLRSMDLQHQEPLHSLKGKRVAALSGIASPQSFEAFLTKEGATLVHTARFFDHHRFTPHEIENFYALAKEKGAEWVVMTEKDSVRFDATHSFTLPTYFLRLEIDILSGDHDFEAALARICFPKKPLQKPLVKSA